MYELNLTHKTTGERNTIYGYSLTDAFNRSHLNPADWHVDFIDYID